MQKLPELAAKELFNSKKYSMDGEVLDNVPDIVLPAHYKQYVPADTMRGLDRNTEISKNDRIEIQHAIDTQLLPEFYKALEKEFSDPLLRIEYCTEMTRIIYKHENIFRVKALLEAPSTFPPYKPNVKKDAKPSVCKAPRFTPPQSAAARQLVNKHIAVGHWRIFLEAIYCSPMMMVPKPGADPPFRPTINMKNVNCNFWSINWPFPCIKTNFLHISKNKSMYFGVSDVQGGYFQLRIAKAFQHYFAVMTDTEVIIPDRLIQGNTDAAKYFQGCFSNALRDFIPQRVINWLDDFILHNNSMPAHLAGWDDFFSVCAEKNVKMSVSKTHLLRMSVPFTGHIMDKDGYTYCPSSYDTVVNMTHPTNGRQLQTFLSCCNWMRESLPNFATVTGPMRDILQRIYEKKGNRTKYGMSKYQLFNFGWDEKAAAQFETIKSLLVEQIKLYIPNDDDTICVFTDSSIYGWGGCVTAVKNFDKAIPVQKQQHRPVGFVSGVFKGSSSNWKIQCKEAFAILQTCLKMEHITRCFPFKLYTDSNNLSYIYQHGRQWPTSDIPRATQDRLCGWSEDLDNFNYTLEHIDGITMEESCFSDIISRWLNPQQAEIVKLQIARTALVRQVTIDSFTNHGYSTSLAAFNWPSVDSITESQTKFASTAKLKLEKVRPDGLLSPISKPGKVWIPNSDLELRVSLCILAHCSLSGHRGLEPTKTNLSDFHWLTKNNDVKKFVKTCLQCKQTKGGRTIPRPWGHVLTGKKRNEVITVDFLYIQAANKGASHNHVYIIAIKDTFSHFVRLYATQNADAEATARALGDWISIFGLQKTPPTILSDRGTHFKNEVIRILAANLGLLPQHFTIAYCPFSNGSIERLNLDLLDLLVLLLAESGEQFYQWPYFLNAIMDILNSYPSPVLNRHSPREVMMGLERTNITELITYIPQTDNHIKLPLAGTDIGSHIDKLHVSLVNMHREVLISKEKRRQSNNKQRAKVALIPDFTIGCYVLHALVKDKKVSKLQIRWTGPYRIISTPHPQVYVVQHLLDLERTFVAHATRLRYYSHEFMNVSTILEDNIKVQDSLRFKLKAIQKHRQLRTSLAYEVLVEWLGFSTEENTWEPVENILVESPEILKNYISLSNKQK